MGRHIQHAFQKAPQNCGFPFCVPLTLHKEGTLNKDPPMSIFCAMLKRDVLILAASRVHFAARPVSFQWIASLCNDKGAG